MIKNHLLKSFFNLSLSTLISNSLNFLAQIYLGRKLGVINFGSLNFYNTIVTYFLLVINFGFDAYFTRACLNNKISFTKAVSFQVISRFIASSSIIFILILLYLGNKNFGIIILLTLSLRLFSFTFQLDWYLRCKNKFNLISLQNVLRSSTLFILIYFFVKNERDLVIAAFITSTSELISILITWLTYKEGITFDYSLKEISKTIKKSFVVNLSYIMISLYYNIDIFVLGIFRSDKEVGLYSAAYKFLLTAIIPTGILYQIYAPKLSENQGNINIAKGYIKLKILTGVLIFIFIAIFHSHLISITYGQDYELSKKILLLLSLDILPCYLAASFLNPIICWGYYKKYFWIVFWGGISNILFNFIFIPKYGINAAITTTIFSELIVFILSYQFMKRKFGLTFRSLFLIRKLNSLQLK